VQRIYVSMLDGYPELIGQTTYPLGGHVLGIEIVVGHNGESAIRDGNANRLAVSLGIESRSLWLTRKLMHVGGRYQGRLDSIGRDMVRPASYWRGRYLVESIAPYRSSLLSALCVCGNELLPTTAAVATSHTEQAQCRRRVQE
jgi:hypothetical protein